MLEVDDLHVRYGRVTALHGVSLDVDEGEIVGLVGPNGAGKTTLLSAIFGLVRPLTRRDRRSKGRSLVGRPPRRSCATASRSCPRAATSSTR